MALTFTESGRSLTKPEIRNVLERFGVRLPDEYIEFLLQHNGGRPKPAKFRYIYDVTEEIAAWVVQFLAFDEGGYDGDGVVGHLATCRELEVPDWIIPVGYSTYQPGPYYGGVPEVQDLICLALNQEEITEVCIWMRFQEGFDEDNLRPVCDSFAELLRMLEES